MKQEKKKKAQYNVKYSRGKGYRKTENSPLQKKSKRQKLEVNEQQ